MLIQDADELKKYKASKRLWQGIPSIEVTKKGRVFLTFYSGGIKEDIGNYALVTYSDDGINFSEPIAVAYQEGYRCYDSCLWIDPIGRLWFTWSRCPDDALFGAICEDPDAENIVFGKEFIIGHNVMMNKPTVISTGEWLFPIAVWKEGVRAIAKEYDSTITPKLSFAYSTCDNGKTFKKLGGADVKNRSYDEHQILELKNGNLRMFVRTTYGIGAADSYDGGKSWGKDFNTGISGPCSRFHITRLKSGRILLINHHNYYYRNNLTAMLSEDEGKTFPYKLLLDERSEVSYPDAKEAEDGYIYITYDRERGYKTSMVDVMKSAREILTARITEKDIMCGTLRDKDSYLKRVACKLTDYDGENKNPYNEDCFLDAELYAQKLKKEKTPEEILEELFKVYKINCINIHNLDAQKLDKLINEYFESKSITILSDIITLIRSASTEKPKEIGDVVDEICAFITENLEKNDSIEEIAKKFNLSSYYVLHIFKEKTGTTCLNYRKAQRIIKAKILLKGCNNTITDIALECGFENSSYFTETFKKEVGLSPSEFRKKHSWLS